MGFPHKPHARETVVLSKYFGDADARTYKGWVKRGGYEMLAQALTTEPAKLIDVVKESGLRGRGGAGREDDDHKENGPHLVVGHGCAIKQ